jgi:orotidine-5'-phosphate decarboxylase
MTIQSATGAHAARERLIVALDFPAAEEALTQARPLRGLVTWVKVGLELYLATGPSIVRQLRDEGFEVFLDLKLHDIPNTVASAIRSVARLGAGLLTVHAAGGPEMLEAAARAAAGGPRLLAVTVLTSMDPAQLHATGVHHSPAEQVLRLGHMARGAGIDGLVCSPAEVEILRRELGETPLLVVPGIRPTGSEAGDQRRIATPGVAIADGASMLVVGRPITQAVDPAAAVAGILAEMDAAASARA